MQKNIIIIIGAAAILVVLVLMFLLNNQDKEVSDEVMGSQSLGQGANDEAVGEAALLNMDSGALTDEAITSEVINNEVAGIGSYEDYGPEKLARAASGQVLLFFHASWCPSCRALASNIEGNLNSIPQGLAILKVNYDTETELKRKYGVTTQHTLVQVDEAGNLIKKWSGGSRLDDLISRLQ